MLLAWEMQGRNIVILHMATSQSEKQHAFPHIDYRHVFDNQKLPTGLNKISIVLACEIELEKSVCDKVFFFFFLMLFGLILYYAMTLCIFRSD